MGEAMFRELDAKIDRMSRALDQSGEPPNFGGQNVCMTPAVMPVAALLLAAPW